MSALCPPRREPRVTHERGQAMLLTVLLLGVGVSAVVYNFVAPAKQSIERDKLTAAALAQAKAALIGYAASNASQPGVLPCPDTDNDGSADAPCGALGATAIGRLPWRTLGVAPLRDGMGECLWYVVSGNFKNSGVSGPAILNSDSPGTLVVNNASGTAVLSGSDAALAIVFAPGAALPTQDRTPAGSSVCGGNTNAASYLDAQTIGGTPFNNATGGGTNNFVMAATTPGPTDLNDKLLPITRNALFPVVEMRVARDLRLSLRQYYTDNRYYPYAAPFPGNASTPNTYRGYVPTSESACIPAPGIQPVSTYLPGYAASPPGWFVSNEWYKVMVYAVAPRCTAKINPGSASPYATPPACALSCVPFGGIYLCQLPSAIDSSIVDCNNTGAGSYLAITGGSATIESIVLAASYRLGAQPVRPCGTIGDCLEVVGADTQNIDTPDNFQYVTPVRSTTNNDNLVIVRP